MNGSPALAVRGVTKAYPTVIACSAVDIEFRAGEIHAVLGQNGAGKSTLVKILGGALAPDAGEIEMGGGFVRFSGPKAALEAGIGVVHQGGSLIETLSVRDNLELGYRPAAGTAPTVHPPAFPPERPVWSLSPRERKMLEIHRLRMRAARILILDEPTAALTPEESEDLFKYLRALAESGCVVIIVSHNVDEILANCDRFTVLCAGRVVARLDRAAVSRQAIEEAISGRDGSGAGNGWRPQVSSSQSKGELLVRLTGVRIDDPLRPEENVEGLDLSLHRGEIVGVLGRFGSGVRTLLRWLEDPPSRQKKGMVQWRLRGRHRPRIGVVPPDRPERGAVAEMSVAENLALRRRELLGARFLPVPRRNLRNFADAAIEKFSIRPPDPAMRLAALSGGNAQKVVLAREIEHGEDLVVAYEPTAGLDLAGTALFRTALRERAKRGACVVVYAEDPDEIAALADRAVVFTGRGRQLAEVSPPHLTAEALGRLLAEASARRQTGDAVPAAGNK